ncbi:MAG TPA: class I SAM-dependent methyltransferase [Ideonella sp.]|uniref:class I SAM-dependent methyltransferase n=1 Tax=Ideonella sp. TaxID=1929293 RepID=UPI002E319323|nr:class I SAM-dependent methyltransferase [Ideonella sp.]HEX5687738.1 class I SAM-dependent methyltransferase [Ideonella sp.]
MQSKLADIAEALTAEGGFSGGPKNAFEKVGRHTFVTLLQQGMRPDSLVLDYGCGVMRLGYWIMRFLDRGGYHGIEPNEEYLAAGKRIVIGSELLAQKAPGFSSDPNFNLAVFNKKFDFIVARSIFTHFTPAAIEKVLASVPASLSATGVFIASYWPSDTAKPHAARKPPLVLGEKLFNEPAAAGINVAYDESTLITIAERQGLRAEPFKQPVCHGQPWMKFTLA